MGNYVIKQKPQIDMYMYTGHHLTLIRDIVWHTGISSSQRQRILYLTIDKVLLYILNLF